MKTLIMLRHAKSDWSGWGYSENFFNDEERPLSERGYESCKKISELFATRQLRVDLVEYSSAKRATDTFNLIKESILFSAHKQNAELYTFNSEDLMKVISNKSNEIHDFLLVGHNPAIEDLIIDLVSPDFNSKDLAILRKKYPTGAVAFIDLNISKWSDLQKKCGNLVEFVRPRDM